MTLQAPHSELQLYHPSAYDADDDTYIQRIYIYKWNMNMLFC